MKEFERLIGRWRGAGELPVEPPLTITSDATIERLGAFVVFRSTGQPAEVPDTLSIIGPALAGEPHPMHYVDSRGVQRRYLTAVEGSTWKIWRAPGEDWNGPDGPGFNQRFIGEISEDGGTIETRWERGLGEAGDQWELDFPMTYVRRREIGLDLFGGIPVREFAPARAWYERLFGVPPAFLATETEAVWEVAGHRWLYIEQVPDRAGHAMHTLFVPSLEARVEEIAARGIAPALDVTYDNGVRKVTYRDQDGNEIGFEERPG
jgi:hypothetical protein